MRIAGIDPGINGAVAVLEFEYHAPAMSFMQPVPLKIEGGAYRRDTGQSWGPLQVLDVMDIPTMGEATQREIDDLALIDWVREWNPDHVYLERVNAMPSIPDKDGKRRGMGAASAFKFGFAAGQIRACVRGCKIPFTLVQAAKWKHSMGLRGPDKEPSRQLAIRLFPGSHDALKRKKDTNRAEAILIARYGALHGDHARAA